MAKVSKSARDLTLGVLRAFAKAKRAIPASHAGKAAKYLLNVLRHKHGGVNRVVRGLTPAMTNALAPLEAWIKTVPLATAAYVVSTLYANLVDAERKRLFAMYFTPPALADHLVREVMERLPPNDRGTFLDPACGGAAFLLPIAIRLRKKLKASGGSDASIVKEVRGRLRGVERDPVLASLAQSFIEIALTRELGGRRLNGVVVVGDSLQLSKRDQLPRAAHIVCNPPYRKLANSERNWYLREYPQLVSQQPNLYSLFVGACTAALRPGGHLMLLTPTGYLTGPSFTPVRKFLREHLAIHELQLLEDRTDVFHQVEHDLCAVFASKVPSRVHDDRTRVASWSAKAGSKLIGRMDLPLDGALWMIPRNSRSLTAQRHSSGGSHITLADYGYVPRVGPYVWNRDTRRKLLGPPNGILRRHAVPVLWASHIRRGSRFRFIQPPRTVGRARFVIPRATDKLGFLTQSCVLIQRTSTAGQRHRLVATAVPKSFFARYKRALAENHVIALIPTSTTPSITSARLASILNRASVAADISSLSGTANITVHSLLQLRVPLVGPRSRKAHKHKETIRSAPGIPKGFRPTLSLERSHEEARPA